jgi:hypothetical protein
MRKLTLLLAITAMLAAGCGRKEPPQAIATAGPPQLTITSQELAGNIIKLHLRLEGGDKGIGYQIDRSEMDPYCNCPSNWQRLYEEPPMDRNRGADLKKLLRLRLDRTYMYRIRAVDGLGRLGSWSKPFSGKAEERLRQ